MEETITTLSKVERMTLANQLRILETLDSENAEEYKAYRDIDLPPNSHPFITGDSRLSFGSEMFSSPPRLCECGKRCLLSTFA